MLLLNICVIIFIDLIDSINSLGSVLWPQRLVLSIHLALSQWILVFNSELIRNRLKLFFFDKIFLNLSWCLQTLHAEFVGHLGEPTFHWIQGVVLRVAHHEVRNVLAILVGHRVVAQLSLVPLAWPHLGFTFGKHLGVIDIFAFRVLLAHLYRSLLVLVLKPLLDLGSHVYFFHAFVHVRAIVQVIGGWAINLGERLHIWLGLVLK